MRGRKTCRYRLRRRFRVARFVSRHNRSEYAIVHPSTKKKGYCQISFFDESGPYSDREHKTCSAAIKDMSGTEWVLDRSM